MYIVNNIISETYVAINVTNNTAIASQGPVVQSIVSSMSSSRDHLVKCFFDFITKYTECFVAKMREATREQCKRFLHFFNKNTGIFEKLTSENLTKR